jgi:hypothetical protein
MTALDRHVLGDAGDREIHVRLDVAASATLHRRLERFGEAVEDGAHRVAARLPDPRCDTGPVASDVVSAIVAPVTGSITVTTTPGR